jgi:hypothetical protein
MSTTTNDKTQKVNDLIALYINQMSDKERKAMEIAGEHLETSFHIAKSNGFREWKKKQSFS